MIEIGETFTVAGINPTKPNPDRRWWQFWKPRRVPDIVELQIFKVVR